VHVAVDAQRLRQRLLQLVAVLIVQLTCDPHPRWAVLAADAHQRVLVVDERGDCLRVGFGGERERDRVEPLAIVLADETKPAAVEQRCHVLCSCERSCYACLRSYHNQTEAHLLDRKLAADFVRAFADASDVQGRRIPVFADGFVGLPRSPIERRLAGSLISAGVPRGHAQYAWGDRGSTDGTPRPIAIADFAWPEHKLAIFCDGWQHHHTPERQAEDRAKRDDMIANGWTVLSFWGGEIVRDSDACAAKIIRRISVAR